MITPRDHNGSVDVTLVGVVGGGAGGGHVEVVVGVDGDGGAGVVEKKAASVLGVVGGV